MQAEATRPERSASRAVSCTSRIRSTRCAATSARPRCDALIDDGLVDAIEVINAKTSLRSLNERAASIAAAHDLAAGAGSDAHVPDAIGAAYVEMPDFDGPADFLAKLRLGRPVGHHWDEPRPWSSRVLPEHDRRVEQAAVPILHAIVLGLVQGLSEFLPISSSGHLLLVPWLFDWHDFDNSAIEKAFDVALHLGTLVAVVGYFRRDLVVYVREGVRLVVRPRAAGRRPRAGSPGCWCCRRFPRPPSARCSRRRSTTSWERRH